MQMKATMRCHHTPILKNRNDSNAGEYAETLDHSHITARDVNGTTLDNSLTVSQNTNHLTMIWFSNCTLGQGGQRNGNLHSHKNLSMNVHSCLTVNSPEVLERTVKQIELQPYHGILLSNKKGINSKYMQQLG